MWEDHLLVPVSQHVGAEGRIKQGSDLAMLPKVGVMRYLLCMQEKLGGRHGRPYILTHAVRRSRVAAAQSQPVVAAEDEASRVVTVMCYDGCAVLLRDLPPRPSLKDVDSIPRRTSLKTSGQGAMRLIVTSSNYSRRVYLK